MGWLREDMCQVAARELQDGFYVNLGIGIPTMVANYIPKGVNVTLQSENGLLGLGAFPTEANIDADLINAGKQTVTAAAGLVKNAGIPAPPARMRSANVPCGLNSSCSSPDKN